MCICFYMCHMIFREAEFPFHHKDTTPALVWWRTWTVRTKTFTGNRSSQVYWRLVGTPFHSDIFRWEFNKLVLWLLLAVLLNHAGPICLSIIHYEVLSRAEPCQRWTCSRARPKSCLQVGNSVVSLTTANLWRPVSLPVKQGRIWRDSTHVCLSRRELMHRPECAGYLSISVFFIYVSF